MTIRRRAALAALVAALPAAAFADGSAATGAKLFVQCQACHSVGATDPSTIGPNLYGVVGARAAAKPDYRYSAALSAAGLTWTEATLDAWLKKPTALVPGNRMAFSGVASPQARADIIAYLATLRPAR